MRKSISLVLLCFATLAHGQLISTSSMGNYSSLGVYSKNFADVFSFASNPAAVVRVEEFTLGVFTSRKFNMRELSQYTIATILPFKFGSIGCQVNHSGYNAYRELELGLAYAKDLGDIELGIKFNYHTLKIPGYGSLTRIIAEFGTIWHPSEKFHTGFHIYNPLALSESYLKEKFAYSYAVGLGYEVSNLVFLAGSFIKEEDKPPSINAGLYYQFARQFFARVGLRTQIGEPYLGAGWKWETLRVDVTCSYHLQLGLSPGFLLVYQPHGTGK